MELKEIVRKFNINDDDVLDIVPFGEGHINDTYLVTCSSNNYILQRLNTKIFPDFEGLMNNIELVTNFIRKQIEKKGGNPNRGTLFFYKTVEGKLYFEDEGNCYRLMNYIDNSIVYQQVENKMVLEEAGICVGQFVAALNNFDASMLCEVIKNFHQTAIRFKTFENSIKECKTNRIDLAKPEIEFVLARKAFSSSIVDKVNSLEIPLRVTHNDTKLNNILFDSETKKALCLIDLDTIMPGSLLYDFGDAVRFACSTAKEDETDLSKVHFDIDLYESFTKGFLAGIGDKITDIEIELLDVGARMMTFECGMRFLTDYLDGDTYFKVKYDEHNLVRARTQLKLVQEMEDNEKAMKDIAHKYKIK